MRQSVTRSIALFVAMSASMFLAESAVADWQAVGPDGGNVTDLWVNPTNIDQSIAASQLNGLFESTDGGTNYTRLDSSPSSVLEATQIARATRLLSAPNSSQQLFLATGNGYRSGSVFRSDDGGATWQAINDGLEVGEGIVEVYDLAFSHDGLVLYAATWAGWYASFDLLNWVHLTFPDASRAQLVTTSPTEASRVYGSKVVGGLYRSDDGGLNWHTIHIGLPQPFTSAFAVDQDPSERLFQSSVPGQIDFSDNFGDNWSPAVTGLTDAAGTASIHFLLALTGNDQVWALSNDGLFRSDDNGATWHSLSLPPQANSPNRLVADARGDIYVLSGEGIHVSTDNGMSWTERHSGIRAHSFDQLQVSEADGSWFVQPLSLFRSADQGASWSNISAPSPVTNATAAVSLSSSNPGRIYAATRESPVVSDDTGQNWTDLPTPGIGLTIRSWTDPTDDQTVIMADFGSGTFSLQHAGLYRSTNGGLSWSKTFEAPLERVNFQPHSVADDPTAPGTVYFGVHSRTGGAFTDGLVLRSTDHGASFDVVLDGMAFTQVIVDAGGHVYAAGTRDSINQGVWRSTDGGNNWQSYSNGLPAPFNTYDLAAHPTRPGHIFATNGFDIYESINGGGSWYELQDIGQTDFTNSIAVIADPAHDYTLLAATRGNIFIGQDLVPDDPLAIPSSNRIGLGLLALALLLMAAISLRSRRQPQM